MKDARVRATNAFRAFAVMAAVGLLLIACTESSTNGAGGELTVAGTPTAGDILTRFQSAGLPIVDPIVYDETTDPNHLIGTVGGYVSKASWRDSRVNDPIYGTQVDILTGGSVEVFESADAAQKRADYIKATAEGFAPVAEHQILSGPTLVRLSKHLTAQQVEEYRAALGT